MSKPIVKESYVKFQSKKIGIWKKRWLVLRTLTDRDNMVVLEKYVDETGSLMGQVKRIINLKNAATICRDPEKKHAISIILDGTLELIKFSLESEADAQSWLTAINNEIASPNSGHKNKFSMYAMRNAKLPIQGECTLLVSTTHLTVLNPSQQEVVQWSFSKIRRYAVERGIFSVESGRSTSTGEGTFLFEGEEADSLYQKVNFLIKSQVSAQPPRLMMPPSNDLPPAYDDSNHCFQNNHNNARKIDSCSSFNEDPYQPGSFLNDGSQYGGSQFSGSQYNRRENRYSSD